MHLVHLVLRALTISGLRNVVLVPEHVIEFVNLNAELGGEELSEARL